MIIPEKTTRCQQKPLPRRERRPQIIELEKKKRKLMRKLRGVNLAVEFTNKSTTSFGNFALVETFKRSMGIQEIIKENLNINKHWNTTYNADILVDYMLDCCILGKTRSSGHFLEFHRACEQMLPQNYVLKGVRVDNGFCDEENVDDFEEKCLEYLVKMKMTERLRTQILALAEEQWHDLDNHYSVAEMEYLPSGWKFPRRVVLGWYKNIRLAANRQLERTVEIIKANLDGFIGFVANGFIPLRV